VQKVGGRFFGSGISRASRAERNRMPRLPYVRLFALRSRFSRAANEREKWPRHCRSIESGSIEEPSAETVHGPGIPEPRGILYLRAATLRDLSLRDHFVPRYRGVISRRARERQGRKRELMPRGVRCGGADRNRAFKVSAQVGASRRVSLRLEAAKRGAERPRRGSQPSPRTASLPIYRKAAERGSRSFRVFEENRDRSRDNPRVRRSPIPYVS